jgi:hypothetical protein
MFRSLRLAPYAALNVALGLGEAALMGKLYADFLEIAKGTGYRNPLGEGGMLACAAGGVAVAGWCVKKFVRQNREAARLEEALANGYEDRTVEPFLRTPCGRAIARIVTSELGYREEYERAVKEYGVKPCTISLEWTGEWRHPVRTKPLRKVAHTSED